MLNDPTILHIHFFNIGFIFKISQEKWSTQKKNIQEGFSCCVDSAVNVYKGYLRKPSRAGITVDVNMHTEMIFLNISGLTFHMILKTYTAMKYAIHVTCIFTT